MNNLMIETLNQYHAQAYRVDSNMRMDGTETIIIPSSGIVTPIIRFRVPRKAQWLIDALPLLIMKLRNTSGVELPRTSKIHIGFKHPVQASPVWVSDAAYSAWNNVALEDQYDVNFQAMLKLPLVNGYLLNEDNEIWFGVSQSSGTSFTLSWGASDFAFDVKQALL